VNRDQLLYYLCAGQKKDQNCVVQIVTTSSRSASVAEQRRSAGAKGERRLNLVSNETIKTVRFKWC